jgi:hypothetical protein
MNEIHFTAVILSWISFTEIWGSRRSRGWEKAKRDHVVFGIFWVYPACDTAKEI